MHSLVVLAVLAYAPPSGRAGPQLGAVSQAVKRALRARGVQVVDGAVEAARARHARGWVPAGELEFFSRARALDAEGRRALEHVELGRAEAAFAEAERRYAAELARPGVAELYGAISLARGIALYELGRAEAARRAFRRAAALDPGAALDETQVRPDVARAFADAVGGAARARAKLFLATDAPAELFVDGRAAGRSPLTLEVSEGEHLVAARAPGHLPSVALFDVAPGGLDARLELPIDPVDAALAALKSRPAQSGAGALGGELALDGVLAVAIGVDAGALTLVGQRLDASGCATRPVTIALDDHLDDAAARLVASLSSAPAACPAPEPTDGSLLVDAAPIKHPRPAPLPPTPPKPKAPRFWERPWIWIGLLAVSSAAVGLAIGLQPSGSTVDITADPSRFMKKN